MKEQAKFVILDNSPDASTLLVHLSRPPPTLPNSAETHLTIMLNGALSFWLSRPASLLGAIWGAGLQGTALAPVLHIGS